MYLIILILLNLGLVSLGFLYQAQTNVHRVIAHVLTQSGYLLQRTAMLQVAIQVYILKLID